MPFAECLLFAKNEFFKPKRPKVYKTEKQNEEAATENTAEQSNTDDNSENSDTGNNNKNRRWIPKSTWRRMKKAELKKQINLVNNLSDLELTENQIKLLNKGLSFSPSPKGVDITHLTADTFHMERNMSWAHIFHDRDNQEEYVKTPFDEKRRKDNMPRHYPDGIKVFSESVRSELVGAQHRKMGQNLTPGEQEALAELQALQKEGKIVMQPGDKNAGICIMNRQDYIQEAMRQLNDTYIDEDLNTCHYYEKVSEEEQRSWTSV